MKLTKELRILPLLLAVFAIAGCDKKDTEISTAANSENVSLTPFVAERHKTTEMTGHFVINPQFDGAYSFSDGLAAVRIGDDKTGKWGFIDNQGHFVINPQFDGVASFSDGLAEVRIGDFGTGKSGFIDKQGKFVINPQFDGAYSFSDGLAAVRIGDDKTGKWGFIDNQGKFVINLKFFPIYPVC